MNEVENQSDPSPPAGQLGFTNLDLWLLTWVVVSALIAYFLVTDQHTLREAGCVFANGNTSSTGGACAAAIGGRPFFELVTDARETWRLRLELAAMLTIAGSVIMGLYATVSTIAGRSDRPPRNR